MKIPYAIINTDLDGFLSGLLLHNFLGTEIVGFCDSGEYVWKQEEVAWEGCTFIDMYVVPPQISTLCNHMIAVDTEHAEDLFRNGEKMNPNVDVATRTFKDSYTTKFSLATVHYIIAKLEQFDHSLIEKIDLRNTKQGYRCIDVILRADDVMNNTVHAYRENSIFWWDKMLGIATLRGQGLLTKSLINYTEAVHSGDIRLDVERHKKLFGNFVKNRFGCDTPDGGYKGLNFGDTHLKKHSRAFVEYLADLTGLKPFPMDNELVMYKGEAKRTNVSVEDLDDIRYGEFRNHRLFSYAFVCRPSSENHFSYTINLSRV